MRPGECHAEGSQIGRAGYASPCDGARVRSVLSEKLVNELGLSLAETACQLGVTTAAIAASLRRKKIKV
jgi:hypothetical protein